MTMLAARLRGGVMGLLVGDALGVPYEFHPPIELPPPGEIEMEPPPGFRRAHDGVLPGTWSDDGAHALCLLASLLHRGRLDVDDLGRRLVNWMDHGYMAVGSEVFDVGVATSDAIDRIRSGIPASLAGGADERSNGNGSLMRVLPLALWHTGSDEELVADARAQSEVTHGHLRAQLCCALYCLWARGELAGATDAWRAAGEVLRALCGEGTAERAELDEHMLPQSGVEPRGTGYVVDCLHSAASCCDRVGFEAVVRAAVALGHDTDTTACVAGGIAGIRHGVDGIPERWRAQMEGMDMVEPLVGELLRHRGLTQI